MAFQEAIVAEGAERQAGVLTSRDALHNLDPMLAERKGSRLGSSHDLVGDVGDQLTVGGAREKHQESAGVEKDSV